MILTATRDGLNKDSDNPADWNDGQPTEGTDKQAVPYRALFIAGPSDKGQELADKVNSGEELTWDDLNGGIHERKTGLSTFYWINLISRKCSNYLGFCIWNIT